MTTRTLRLRDLSLVAILVLILSSCSSASGNEGSSVTASGSSGSCTPADTPVITLAAYSNPYDAYGKLTSSSGTFGTDWKDKHDQSLIFQMSFGGSTTQAQNIVNGFPADVFAASTATDVELVQDAGLITHDWTKDPDSGIVATSVVGFMVRPGNPKGIHDWSDLTKPGLQILTPDPAQSGGARWNIVAAYGAAMRGNVPGYAANSSSDAEKLLEGIFKNVTVLDKSANDSFKNWASGNGDVAITYENQALAGLATGTEGEFVIPSSTILIQTPTVVVDKNAEAHCNADVVDAFVKYLHSPDAQSIFQSVGYQRPIDLADAQKGSPPEYPAVKDLFTTDDLGGWDQIVGDTVFGPNGAFTQAQKAVS